MKTILVLGAGLVAKPLVDYLLQKSEFEVSVADLVPEKAAGLVAGRARGRALKLDIENEQELSRCVANADLAVSFVPFGYHPRVARHCLEQGKHLITASYLSDDIRAMDAPARAKGLVFLNEAGLDPGLDHMEARRVLDESQSRGGEVTAFISYCGGLPAPEANDNVFAYKFSWSPLGVLLASKNPARYLWDGREVLIPGDKLFDHPASVSIEGLGTFEAYPNRDSMPYLRIYGLPGVQTLLRGTLRWPGWCRTLKRIKELNLLDEAEEDFTGMTLRDFLLKKMGVSAAEKPDSSLRHRIQDPAEQRTLECLEWLGLLSDKPVPPGQRTGLQVMASLMADKLRYAPGERDMVVLRHEVTAGFPDGMREKSVSTLIVLGIPGGDSAMARTVGLPAAICARLILEGRIQERGVLIPTPSDIYRPVLRELESFGIRFVEKRESSSP